MNIKQYSALLLMLISVHVSKAMITIQETITVNTISEQGVITPQVLEAGTTVDPKSFFPKVQGPYSFERCLTAYAKLAVENATEFSKADSPINRIINEGFGAKTKEALQEMLAWAAKHLDYVDAVPMLKVIDSLSFTVKGYLFSISTIAFNPAHKNKFILAASIIAYKTFSDRGIIGVFFASDLGKNYLLKPTTRYVYDELIKRATSQGTGFNTALCRLLGLPEDTFVAQGPTKSTVNPGQPSQGSTQSSAAQPAAGNQSPSLGLVRTSSPSESSAHQQPASSSSGSVFRSAPPRNTPVPPSVATPPTSVYDSRVLSAPMLGTSTRQQPSPMPTGMPVLPSSSDLRPQQPFSGGQQSPIGFAPQSPTHQHPHQQPDQRNQGFLVGPISRVSAMQQQNFFRCLKCSYPCSSKSALDNHMRTHNQPLFQCPKCASAFTQKSLLDDHLKTHISSSASPFRNTPFPTPAIPQPYSGSSVGQQPFGFPPSQSPFNSQDSISAPQRSKSSSPDLLSPRSSIEAPLLVQPGLLSSGIVPGPQGTITIDLSGEEIVEEGTIAAPEKEKEIKKDKLANR